LGGSRAAPTRDAKKIVSPYMARTCTFHSKMAHHEAHEEHEEEA
jgi:hypothetical protein